MSFFLLLLIITYLQI